MKEICLDTGILGIYLSINPGKKIQTLIQNIRKGLTKAFVLKPVLIEVFYNLCKIEGKEIASIKIANLRSQIPFNLVDLDDSLILKAGILKCQHRTSLSYIDCMSIAFCLNTNTTFHTTEKMIKKIPNNTLNQLKIEKYSF